jgi:hypothetical protein
VSIILEHAFHRDIPYTDSQWYLTWAYVTYLWFFLPVYAAVRGPAVLMLAQAAVFAACVPLLYGVGRRLVATRSLALAFPLLFILSPMVQMLGLTIFKGEPFLPVVFGVAYLLLTRRDRAAGILSLFILFTRADVAPLVILAGLWLRLRRHRLGPTLIALGVAYLALSVSGVILATHLADSPLRWERFHVAGVPTTAVDYFLVVKNQLLSLAPWCFLPLLAPEILALGAVNLAFIVLSTPALYRFPEVQTLLAFDHPFLRQIHSQQYVLITVYFGALLLGVRRLLSWLQRRWGATVSRRALEYALTALLLLVGATLHVFFASSAAGPVPFARGFDVRDYCSSPRAVTAWDAIDRPPVTAHGATGMVLYERAYHIAGVRRLNAQTEFLREDDFALFDLRGFVPDMPKDVYLGKVRAALSSNLFYVDLFRDGILLLNRGAPTADNAVVLDFLAAHHDVIVRNDRPAADWSELSPPVIDTAPPSSAAAPSPCPSGWLRLLDALSPG